VKEAMPASPIIDVIRVNARTFAWSSCAFSCDGMPWEGVVGIDWEERLDTRVVYSNQQDGAPLGMAQGRYQIATFPLRMLRDTAKTWKNYLTAQASTKGSGSYGQAVFELGLQLAGRDAGDLLPTSTLFSSCRVLGEKVSHEEGIDELVTEFQIGCLLIEQDGNSLWNALPAIVGGFPVADTITVAGLPAPGKWTLEKADKVYGWQVQKGTGLSGATVIPTGDELVEPEFLVEFWDPLDFQAFKLFRTAFLKKALVAVTGSPVGLALGIDHPELKELGCQSVVVRSITPVLNDSYGVWSCKVKFLQYRKPGPALSKPSAAIPDNGTPRPTAKTQTEIALLQGQATLQALKDGP
jgi:hypothetical protein